MTSIGPKGRLAKGSEVLDAPVHVFRVAYLGQCTFKELLVRRKRLVTLRERQATEESP